MKKVLSVIVSLLLVLTGIVPAFAAERTVTPGARETYEVPAVAQGNVQDLSYEQIASILLDWLDRKIVAAAADFNAFVASIPALGEYEIKGVDTLIGMKDHVAELEGDFANLNTAALVTRENGDLNFLFGVFQFMADNADTFGKVFRWDDQVFDYGKVGAYIESLPDGDEIKAFYEDYLVNGDIQDKFIREIAREMNYEVPETRTETFDEIISNGVKSWFLGVVGDMISEESKAAVQAMDLRTTDVYTLVKEFVGLLQNDYKDQLDGMLESFLQALQGMVKIVKEAVNVEPPELTVGYTGNDPYATYHPASTEMSDYMPVIYANDQAINTLRQYADEEIDVLANSEMSEADKALVAGTGEAWGRNVLVKAVANDETLIDLDVDLGALETAVIAALEENVNGQSQSIEAMGTTVAFNISDAQATFSYKMYKDVDSFAAQVKVESATAKVNVTSPIQATVTANLLDPDSTTVDFGMSFINQIAQPMVVSAIKTAVGDMFKDPAFATVILNNLDGKIEELEKLQELVNLIDADATYDETLLDVMADYDAYKGVVGQANHILYKTVDMIASDSGMADLGLTDGGNQYLTENLEKICNKVSGLLDMMKQYIDRDTFIALAEGADISASFASEHGFNAGMIYDMDFSSVENALDCGIRVACDLLAEDDPDSIFYQFHMRVEDLDTLDQILVAALDMVLEKAVGAVELEGWDYTYTAMDYANVAENGAKAVVLDKVADIVYAAATFATGKINAVANDMIGELNNKLGLGLGNVEFKLGVEKAATGEETLNAIVDRFVDLTNGLMIESGNVNKADSLEKKAAQLLFAALPMESMFSNVHSAADLEKIPGYLFDEATDGDLVNLLGLFEVKEDAIAGNVPVTKALINASDRIVDAFFPDTVEAQLYTASLTVQEEFTGCESDQGIAARNMVSINNRKAHLIPAILELVRESGILPSLVCDHTDYEEIEAKPATCVEEGNTAGKRCKVCGTLIEGEILPIDPNNHVHTSTIAGKAATCTEKGLTEGVKCDDCGKTVTAQTEIGALGHDWVKGQTVAPTCSAEGYTVYECSRCHVTEQRDKTGRVAHVDNNNDGVCDYGCGTEMHQGGGDEGGSGNGGNFFSNLWQRIVSFFQRIGNFFRNLFNR